MYIEENCFYGREYFVVFACSFTSLLLPGDESHACRVVLCKRKNFCMFADCLYVLRTLTKLF